MVNRNILRCFAVGVILISFVNKWTNVKDLRKEVSESDAATFTTTTTKTASSSVHPPDNSANDSSAYHSSGAEISIITPEQQAWFDFETEIGRRVTYVTARFHTQDGKFASMVRNFATRLLEQGFPSSRLHAYADRGFPSFIRNDTRYLEHLAFLDYPRHPSARGAGYWFWKPLLIRHHLAELRDGDFLIYCDTDDHTGEAFQFGLLQNLMRSMVDNETKTTTQPSSPSPSGTPEQQHASGFNLAVKQVQDGGGYYCPEKHWTKGVTYRHFCGPHRNQSIDDTGQFYANFVVVKKTPATIELYDGVAEAAADYYLINDVDKQHPDWLTVKDHRHDQSLLSCSLKCRYHSLKCRYHVREHRHRMFASDLYLLALSPWNNETRHV